MRLEMFFPYLLEVSFCVGIFYAFYQVLLAKETYFRLNRLYLIFGLLISLLIPALDFNIYADSQLVGLVQLPELIVGSTSVEGTASTGLSAFSWVVIIYLTGVLIAFVHFLRQIFSIRQIIQAGQKEVANTHVAIKSNKITEPFSFWKYIIWDELYFKDEKQKAKILKHELAHVQQYHTLDVMMAELSTIFLWFNPFIYWYKQAIKENHEYLADQAAVQDDYISDYARILLQQSLPALEISIGNHFHSPLQKRIIMMTKNPSSIFAKAKFTLFVPILAMMFAMFSCNVSDNAISEADMQTYASLEASDQVSDDNTTFQIVEQMPEFPGGQDAMLQYIYTNIKYPEDARTNGVEGMLVVEFVVEKDGSIQDIEVIRPLGHGCNEEVIRIIESMPKWTPGRQKGEIVKVSYKLPVRFKLADDTEEESK